MRDGDSKELDNAPAWLRLALGLAWPLVVLILAFGFREALRSVVDMRDKQSMSLEASTTGFKVAITSAANVIAASQKQAGPDRSVPPEAVSRITATASSVTGAILSNRRILWIDDNPSNNTNLVAAFAALGAQITTALSNDDALQQLGQSKYDLIITDVGRPSGQPDGLQIVPRLRAFAPVAVYAGRYPATHRGQEEASKVGLITNDPSLLYSFVVSLLRH